MDNEDAKNLDMKIESKLRIKSILNVSIDDISPHKKSSILVLQHCRRLMVDFPNIKFSLFVPTAYWRTIKKNIDTTNEKPYFLYEYKKFCQKLKKLPKKNFEICYHGVYHGIPDVSNNDEFRDLSYEETIEKIKQMKRIVHKAEMSQYFKDIFRPPAWYVSPEGIKAFQDSRFKYLSLSPQDIIRKANSKDWTEVVDKDFSNIAYYNICPPFIDFPKKLYYKTSVVYHACEWSENCLNSKNRNILREYLNKNIENISFGFTKDIITDLDSVFMTLGEKRNRLKNDG